ncbi:MAG: mycofactocin-coupled SDR family oxidoreductase [Acidimicrobiia bacterium]
MAGAKRVEGKVAFITGAARGQGRAHAVRLAEEGADIIAVDLCAQVASVPYPMGTAEDLAETVRLVEQLDRRIVALEADVRDNAALGAALATGVAQLGRLDIVLANAGIWSGCPSVDMPVDMWQDMIDINLTGVWNTCQVSLRHLIEGGRGGSIIITSSSAGIRTGANIVHYSAAKHGVVGIMRTLANELAPHFIRVNTIHPTAVATPMLHNEPMFQLFRPDLENPTIDDATPMFQGLNALPIPWVEAIDISNAVLFLASDESRYITSVSLPVDAGSTQR